MLDGFGDIGDATLMLGGFIVCAALGAFFWAEVFGQAEDARVEGEPSETEPTPKSPEQNLQKVVIAADKATEQPRLERLCVRRSQTQNAKHRRSYAFRFKPTPFDPKLL